MSEEIKIRQKETDLIFDECISMLMAINIPVHILHFLSKIKIKK